MPRQPSMASGAVVADTGLVPARSRYRRIARRATLIAVTLVLAASNVASAAPTVGGKASGAAPTSSHEPDAVAQWNQLASSALLAAGNPPHIYVLHMAMVHAAVYDAVNAIAGGFEPYIAAPAAAQAGDSQASAAATAAHDVLVALLPSQSGALDAALGATLAQIADGAAKTGGIAVGRAAAAALLADRVGDGRYGAPGFPTGGEPGDWRPVPPAFVNDPNAWLADVRPFLIPSASQFRSDGPNAMSSDAYARDFAEVKSKGSATSATRTADETTAVRFWGQGHPTSMWNLIFRSLAAANGLGQADEARLYAMLYLTATDAAIACWDDKRHWGFWRPITAIREADSDGNPATEADPTWTPYLPTPPYPDHPSAHACISGSIVYTLQDFFGTDRMVFGTTNPANGIERHFDRFRDAVKEIIDARVWAGLHFRIADVQGSIIGMKVAHWRDRHYFAPVD